jgi:hypothetical protein
MTLNLIAQLVGIVAVIFSLLIFQQNKRLVMLQLATTAAFLYTIHFFMLGALTGAMMNLIGAGRCYVFYKVTPNKHNEWILWAFLGLSAAATIATWQGPISLLALAGSVCSGIASWKKEPRTIRRFALSAPPLWFTYNAISGSYPGMFIEIAILASNLVGQRRFDFKHKSRAQRQMARPA